MRDDVAKLPGDPAISFSTSGWSYANRSDPFLLTEDVLTNAMIGVSRLAPGEPILNSAVQVPSSLDTASIQEALARRLAGKSDLKISVETIGGRSVVVAEYGDAGKRGLEIAFGLEEYLIHVLLLANPGRYFADGETVARHLVETLRPL